MTRLFVLFIYTLSLNLTLPALFPSLRLLFFAPFIVLSFYHENKIKCLWIAMICGFIIDLFASQTRLGFYALTYCLTTQCLYAYKRNFFEDSFSTIPLMTFFFAILATLIQCLLLYSFGEKIMPSWEWIKNDLFWMPLLDALYAIFCFSFPLTILPAYRSRRRFNRLLSKGR